jgi:Mg2+/Co2+ transporter CorB
MIETGDLVMFGVVFLLLIAAAFFSAAETSVTSVSRARIHKLKTSGNKKAGMVERLRKDQSNFFGTILLGNNLLNTLSSAITTSLLIKIFGSTGVIYATLIMTALIFVFTEVLPKTIAFQHAERTAMFVAPVLVVMVKVMKPLNFAVDIFTRNFIKMLRLKGSQVVSPLESLKGAIELHHAEGVVARQDKEMLSGIIDMMEMQVSEIMAHRKEMVTVDIKQSADKQLKQLLDSGHSRIPLWDGDPQNIIGILYLKNLIRALRDNANNYSKVKIQDIMDDAWFIPEATTLRNQLHAFRQRRKHMAIVVDEYGAIQGLITLEDILEVIVGEIDDEHDWNFSTIKKVRDNVYIVDGSTMIRDINRQLDWKLPDENASTVAGLLIYDVGDIPEEGAEHSMDLYSFKVLKRQGNQIGSLQISRNIAE